MPAPTYSLTAKNGSVRQYYSAVEVLAAEVLAKTAILFRPVTKLEMTPSAEQACLELLMLGVYARRKMTNDKQPSLEHLDYVVSQLERAKDFTFQSQKIRFWQRILFSHSASVRDFFWDLINDATNWFAWRSSEVLGAYTAHVENFVTHFDTQGRADALLCTSPRLEYHLNMVGAEILNKLWLKSYLKTDYKLVVVPGCLRANALLCEAGEWTLGFACKHCNQDCQISKLTKLAAQQGLKVSFVKHQSSLVSHVQDLSVLEQKGSLGVLGVACVLSLLEGGFLLEAHQVPAQCVPLDFCGCQSHWHNHGITPRVNLERVRNKAGKK